MTPGLDRQLELGADAVVGGDQQRIGVARRLQVEEAAEAAELRIRARPSRRSGKRADRLDQRIAGVDRHAGVGIGQWLLAHLSAGTRDKPLGFPRRCRQKTRANAAPPSSLPLHAARSPPPVSAGSSTRSWRAPTAASFRSTARTRWRSAESTSTSAAPDAQTARYAGWRIAQRQGFKALWAKMHNAPVSAGAEPSGWNARPDRELDQRRAGADRAQPLHRRPRRAVRSRLARHRSSASKAARSERSAPMLLIPITVSGRHGDERRVAQRLAARLGAVPDRRRARSITSASAAWAPIRCWSTRRRRIGPAAAGGATCSICTALPTFSSPKSSCSGSIPGGPARARFIARHGPDDEIVGGFTLTAPNSDGIPAMMAAGRAADGPDCSPRRLPPAG